MADGRRIRIRALDRDDMQIVSACLQDALVPLGEIAFLKKERRFAMVANRFKWELGGDPESAGEVAGEAAGQARAQAPADAHADADAVLAGACDAGSPKEGAPEEDARFEDEAQPPPFERTNCGVCFDKVVRVRFRGIDRAAKDQILNLLAIEPGEGVIDLVFSEGAAIRLEVTGISCHLEDLGEPWPTRWHPSHELDPGE